MTQPAVSDAFDVIANADLEGQLPQRVIAALPHDDVLVFAVDDSVSDTAAFSAHYGFSLEDCANTILVRYKKEGAEHHAAVVTLGSHRVDVNGALKAQLAAQRLSFAKREDAVALSGMEFGGITAFGLPEHWRVIVDASVMDRPRVVMGAGVRRAKLLLAPQTLHALPNLEVAAVASPVPQETPDSQ